MRAQAANSPCSKQTKFSGTQPQRIYHMCVWQTDAVVVVHVRAPVSAQMPKASAVSAVVEPLLRQSLREII